MFSTDIRCRYLISCIVFLTSASMALANNVSVQEESHKLIRANEAIGTLGVDAFGDSVNLYTGELEFLSTDIDLIGNDILPVRLGRKFSIDSFGPGRSDPAFLAGLFGDWDIDLPMIHGVFSEDEGFVVDAIDKQARCSSFGVPPDASANAGASGLFSAEEFWHGTSLYVPGVGNQEILLRSSNNGLAPENDIVRYPLVTKNHWQIECSLLLKNGEGEGFSVLSPSGVRYQFDWLTYRKHRSLSKATPAPQFSNLESNNYILFRTEARIYPTKIEDRFGNYVEFNWIGNKIVSIASSDGRRIDIEYVEGTNRIKLARNGQRQWQYFYDSNNHLDSVKLPDGASWGFELLQLFHAHVSAQGASSCSPGSLSEDRFVGTVSHPSGAVGRFEIAATRHGRTYVSGGCTPNGYVRQAPTFDTLSLMTKEISGPGLATPYSWRYEYSLAQSCLDPVTSGTACTAEPYKTLTVVDHEDVQLRYTFGTRYRVDEGKMLKREEGRSGNWLRATHMSYAPISVVSPNPVGRSLVLRGDSYVATHLIPEESRVGVLSGVSYLSKVEAWDEFGQPTLVMKSNGQRTKRESIVYANHKSGWVIGQIATVTDNTNGSPVVELDIEYDGSALPVKRKVFGRLDQSMTYCTQPLVSGCNAVGLLRTVRDGANKTTTFGNHKRGIPQFVSFADMQSISGVVNDYGWVTAYTDELGNTTSYQYDNGGRLSKITYPTGDTTAWTATDIAFSPVTVPEYGVGAGHWKQSITTGRYRKETVFDALWRPVVTREWDSGLPGNDRFVARRFDADGRETFVSYPESSLGAFNDINLNGVTKAYDALGRLRSTSADSELGDLNTTISYSQGRKHIQNPRQITTSIAYQQFDSASEDHPIEISGPGNVLVNIERDVWGKPKWIERKDTASGASVRRSYVYDTNQRLCKTLDPERGAEVFNYDSANRISWTAAGTGVSLDLACDNSSVPTTLRAYRFYDNRDRLTGVTYPSGTYNETREYYADGALRTATLGAGQENEMRWEYQYNKRRLPTEARAYIGGQSSAMNWTYDSLGHLANIRHINGFVLVYSPNAFGQPTQVRSSTQAVTYADQISYYPNGALKGFRYGNGVLHQLDQNQRKLPSRSRDWNDFGTFVDTTFAYDANGNPTLMDDALNIDDKWLVYDDRDRLDEVWKSQNGPFKASMDYDAFDNLTRYQVGGRNWYYETVASTQRVNRVYDSAGTNQITFAYDGHGNVNRRTTSTLDRRYVYDAADRLITVRDSSNRILATHIYDALGRRTRTDTPVSGNPKPSLRFQVYTPDGEFQWENDLERNNTATGGHERQVNYIRLAGSLIAKQIWDSDFTENTTTTTARAPGELDFNPFRNPYENATVVDCDAQGAENGNGVGNGNGHGQGCGNAGGNGNGNGNGGGATDPSAARVVTTSIKYLHTDALGSPVAESRHTAMPTPERRTQYEPYGVPLTTPDDGAPSYTGHQYDRDTGLVYAQQRYYDPMLGRFHGVDPMAVDTNSAFNFNRYAYANNSPYRFTDPDGRDGMDTLGESMVWAEPGYADKVSTGYGGLLVAMMCACDPDYVAPNGSGEATSVSSPIETVATSGTAYSVRASRLAAANGANATADLFHIAKSGGAAGNRIYNDLAKLGNQAAGATGKQASSLLQSMAKKAGMEVKAGGKHLKVINPETKKLVTTIPHSPKGSGTIREIAKEIMKEAGF